LRVLHVIDALGVGGTELGLAKLIEGTREDIIHSVCCIRAGGETADRLQACGTSVVALGKQPGIDWTLALRVARVCQRLKPDVIHTRNWGSIEGVIGGRLARVPVVIHGEHGREAWDVGGRNPRRNRVRRLLSPFIDRMVAVSESLRRWLIDEVGIRADKVALVRNGVDSSRFQPPASRDRLRGEQGYGPEEFLVGTVGRLDPIKNQASLLEAVGLLYKHHPRMRLAIVGDGPEREGLERQVHDRGLAGVVRLVGHSDDIPAWLGRFDLFVLPSLGEGMCNTILEAMAVGLPVVATCVGGNPELVVDGVTGRLVQARDADALAHAIESYAVSDHVRQQHGSAGRDRVLQQFTLQRMLREYVSLYNQELKRRGRKPTPALPERTCDVRAGANDW
jgi:sugar transferase (PEP-CTERM/EpsH1 system associated)